MITIVGLGPAGKDSMSMAAHRSLCAAKNLYFRTRIHQAAIDCENDGLQFRDFDRVYETSASFDDVYSSIVNQVFDIARNEDITYAVPGHPLVAEETVRQIISKALTENIPFEVISSSSFIESTLGVLRLSINSGILFLDALGLAPQNINPDLNTLFYQVFDEETASNLKLKLMDVYPEDWNVTVVKAAGQPADEQAIPVPLFELDRCRVDHLTSVYVPALPKELQKPQFRDLVEVMARLRLPGGCPWDREQDHNTLKRYFIEETYEAIEAIDLNDMDALCEELGDVLLQVVFHARLEEEIGIFDIQDVIASIVNKLVRRHPHVFGTTEVADSEEVLKNWEQIKKSEKGEGWRKSLLDGVPKGLPALMMATEISKKAAKAGFEWEQFEDVVGKLDEEVAELKEAISSGDTEKISAEMGDLLFTVVNIARWKKIDSEDTLRTMVNRFRKRFHFVEQKVQDSGKTFEEFNLAELDAFWDAAKSSGL